jgi:hypothetical protein
MVSKTVFRCPYKPIQNAGKLNNIYSKP